ncbi:MAG: histidine kinase [Bryobacterales bacterium]|nr:histidine kinase [Bryobacterales bacterium]MEB2360560.1 triple tyrosine motif-containing protein [Bryobacterales bacterium]
MIYRNFFLLLLAFPANCDIAVDSWTTENGLPQNIVSGICQTPDGYLWLATLDGLVRFDGVRFTIHDRSNTPGIKGNRFNSLFCTADGGLWAATEGTGVTQYHAGRFTTYTVRDGLLSNIVPGISGDSQGNLWVLADDVVHRWRASESRFIPLTGKQYSYTLVLSPDGHSGFARIVDGALELFVAGRQSRYPLPPGWPRDARTLASSTAWDFNHRIWLTDRVGTLAYLSDGRWSRVFRVQPATSTYSLPASSNVDYRDSQGNTWKFDLVWDGTRIVPHLRLPLRAGSQGIGFRSMYEDPAGNIWLSTDGQGLFRVRVPMIEVYSREQGLPDGNVYPICQTRDGAIWIGTWSGGLSRLKDGKLKTYTTADGLASNRVQALFEDREGRLWVSVEHGLHVLRNGRFESVVGYRTDSSLLQIRVIHQDRRGVMYFGQSQGLMRLEQGRWTSLGKKDGLATDDIRAVVDSRDGSLWVAGYGGLSNIREGRVQSWTEYQGLPATTIRALYEDQQGVLWIGSYDGGLARLENGKFARFTVAEGLFSNGVFRILEDARANFWMSCNRGIYRISKRELNEFAAGKRKTIVSVPYGKRDGMKNAECNGGLSPAGIQSSDGRLWFPTQDGVAVIDPRRVKMNPKPPPVVIEACLIDRMPAGTGNPVRLLPGNYSLEIQYTALSFLDAERIRFRYQVQGLDHDWIEAGTRRTVYYSHLPPGNYTFRVTAANSDGIWNEQGASLSFVVLPPFYRTWWFTLLLSIGAIACLWLVWSHRLAQVERARVAQQAFSRELISLQEAERKRIAAELHDSLGQRLVVIRNLSLLSRNSSNGNQQLQQQIDEISAESSQALQEVREISYNLRPHQLERLGLRKAILALVRTISRATAAHLDACVDEIDEFFPKEAEINFYRIVQECLNNVIKHSGATEVSLTIGRHEKKLSLLIRDNGRGFTPGTAASDRSDGGFGLAGIRERAQLLGGKTSIRTAPGEGTMITIEIEAGAL